MSLTRSKDSTALPPKTPSDPRAPRTPAQPLPCPALVPAPPGLCGPPRAGRSGRCRCSCARGLLAPPGLPGLGQAARCFARPRRLPLPRSHGRSRRPRCLTRPFLRRCAGSAVGHGLPTAPTAKLLSSSSRFTSPLTPACGIYKPGHSRTLLYLCRWFSFL